MYCAFSCVWYMRRLDHRKHREARGMTRSLARSFAHSLAYHDTQPAHTTHRTHTQKKKKPKVQSSDLFFVILLMAFICASDINPTSLFIHTFIHYWLPIRFHISSPLLFLPHSPFIAAFLAHFTIKFWFLIFPHLDRHGLAFGFVAVSLNPRK